ncbi:uncharacterized protein BCR38DRAFT_405522 [Pseudomassariella vexata]|uniref:Uncharacterized protein n=1 Tax=Pseudomassariella vexata TaxID=1141098 RepID=A0A1Y2EE46_9PEZI|nr:uncharacterized protein BCR38DRAFT_405522 [Pseudomassariella vexata]ORY69853.1 hypothetical protein BCR38DRAFT_405522 [Pseudomassariella vexata]
MAQRVLDVLDVLGMRVTSWSCASAPLVYYTQTVCAGISISAKAASPVRDWGHLMLCGLYIRWRRVNRRQWWEWDRPCVASVMIPISPVSSQKCSSARLLGWPAERGKMPHNSVVPRGPLKPVKVAVQEASRSCRGNPSSPVESSAIHGPRALNTLGNVAATDYFRLAVREVLGDLADDGPAQLWTRVVKVWSRENRRCQAGMNEASLVIIACCSNCRERHMWD